MQQSFALVRSRLRHHPVKWLGLLLCAVGVLLVGAVGSTQAAEPWSVQVIGTTGPNDTAIDTMSYADAKAALTESSTTGTDTVLPVAPSGFPGVTSDGATLELDDTARTLTVSGPTTLLGVNATVLVAAVWDNAADTTPSVTVVFKTGATSLKAFAPSLSAVDVGLTSAWTAFRRDNADTSTLVVDDLPENSRDFFDDGNDSTDDDLTVGAGVAFRALVTPDSAGLGKALDRMGISSARLDGTLSDSDEVLESGAAAPTGFALSATVTAASPATMPDWLELGDTWTLSLAKGSAGLTIGVAGDATVTLGDTAVPVAASAAVTMAGSALSVELNLDVDTIEAPFGAEWLTLESASVKAAISGDGVSAELSADVTVGTAPDDLTGSVTMAIAKSADGLSGSLEAALTGTISSHKLVTLVGGNVTGLSSGVDVTLTDPALYVGVDAATKALTVSATGKAAVVLDSVSYGANMLVRSSPDGVIVAADPDADLTLSDIVGTVSPDPVLPDLSLVVSTKAFKSASADLDTPTRKYFQAVLCPDAKPSCDFELDLDPGVALEASIELPDGVADSLDEIGLAADGPLRVSGKIPAFGGTSTSLTVALPNVATTGDGFIRGAGLAVEIGKAGSALSFALEGSVTLGVPRVEGDTCPSNLYVGTTCIDEVKFSLAGKFTLTPTSTSFRIEGAIESGSTAGWQQPFGIPYLTLHQARLVLGVTAGPTTSVDIGFLGQLVVGQTDISISALVGVTPNKPYLDFKGFTGSSKNGLSMKQLGKLYTDVSGQTVPDSIIPPVGIRNLFLSIGRVDDESLCLRTGFYLSGDLYLDKGTPTGTAGASCLPPPNNDPEETVQCKADDDCLASVLVDVQTGKGGGIPSVDAAGFVKGWNAGPLTFDDTIVKLNLSKNGARVFLKAGAKLVDPIEYFATGSSTTEWAAGTITLDIGTQRFLVKGDVMLAKIIEAGIMGSGKFDISDPDFEFSVYLRAAWLEDIAAGIDEAIKAVDMAADEFAKAFSSQNMETVFSEIRGAYNDLGNPGSATWQTLSSGYFDFRDDVDSANNTLERWGFGRPIPINQLLDLALFGIVTPDIPGLEICLFGGCATIIPSINIPDIPGMCSYVPVLKSTAICTGPKSQVDEVLRAQYAAPVIKSEVVDAGLTVPTGVSVDTLVSKFAAIEPTSTPANRSARAVATSGTEVNCAVSQVSFTEGTISDTTFDVQTMGTVVTITGDEPAELAAKSGEVTAETADEAEQDTLNALLTSSDAGGCTGSAPPPGPSKVLSMTLDQSLLDEGSTLVASGKSVGGTVGEQVTVTWGDGSTSTTTLAAGLTWTASHVYPDDTGSGTSTTYTVKAEATDHAEAIRRFAVVNVAPEITGLTLPTAPVDETDSVTVSGTVVDPGTKDTHTVVVDWGDGTAPVPVPVVGGAFSAAHVYADDNPSATNRDVMPVSVVVKDKDNASTDELGNQTVSNTAAYGLTFASQDVLTDKSTTFTRTGRIISWKGAVSDKSTVDLLRTEIGWGDGSGTDLMLTNGGALSRPIAAEHGWTQPCLYQVTADVADDDLGSATPVSRWTVVTRATAAKEGGSAWWTRQFRELAAGRGSALTPTQASCYLAVARHVSPTFAKKLRLGTSAAAYDVLSMNRQKAGPAKPSMGQTRLQVERAKLDRALLGALLDFVHGKQAWDAPVIRREKGGFIRFAQLVAMADKARSARSVATMVEVRKALTRI